MPLKLVCASGKSRLAPPTQSDSDRLLLRKVKCLSSFQALTQKDRVDPVHLSQGAEHSDEAPVDSTSSTSHEHTLDVSHALGLFPQRLVGKGPLGHQKGGGSGHSIRFALRILITVAESL
jgi:hypothetical protein